METQPAESPSAYALRLTGSETTAKVGSAWQHQASLILGLGKQRI
ncbi:MAG: hypothetical protein ACF787_08975 [Rhodopirellula sp. JB053]